MSHVFFCTLPRPPRPTLFPYTTLFRSPMNQRPSLTTTEPAPWSAYRDLQRPYGFASFDFEPHAPGGHTQITVKHYRSEEHTSELQSLTNLVCRLLLEKKKKKTT